MSSCSSATVGEGSSYTESAGVTIGSAATSATAAGAGEVAKEGESKDDEGGLSETSLRGERSREDFFSSIRANAAASPGTNVGACGDIWVDIAAAAMTTAAQGMGGVGKYASNCFDPSPAIPLLVQLPRTHTFMP